MFNGVCITACISIATLRGMVNPLLQHRYMLCPDARTLRNCIISSEPGRQHPPPHHHHQPFKQCFWRFCCSCCAHRLSFNKRRYYYNSRKFLFNPFDLCTQEVGLLPNGGETHWLQQGDWTITQPGSDWLLKPPDPSPPVRASGVTEKRGKINAINLVLTFTKTEATENV